ncbi:Radical SAM domain protein [Clostridium sp. DL-VIII]|uniref:radical SAM protein n=1 Tax=Clostridium sp. DL-VIII TaxID=641107 RepID=UPI00023B079D|nr:radical SAM protein [Clostridium sp. DL-VIII]EHJ02161.1 Radical SAM domain protein [Clostridium sp. DL-VIII]
MISINSLIKEKETGDIYRLGATFSTDKSDYLYDTGTGKVVQLDDESSPFITGLFDENICASQLRNIADENKNIDNVTDFFNEENLLCNSEIKHFIPLENKIKEENLQMEQLIIELTGKCNLRCKYCIYNDYNDGTRNFNTESIEFETAKKAIDYIYLHRSNKRLAITFYGGEPLVKFDVMKQCIEYSLEHLKDCNLSFSLTTNLTLITKEIADYLARIPNLSIVVSLDGPEEVQNTARVYVDGKPTFKDAFRGLKILSEAINKYKNTTITVNAVLLPPYTVERLEKINRFFESLDFLSDDTEVRVTYPSQGTVPESYFDELKNKGYDDYQIADGWFDWAIKKTRESVSNHKTHNIYSYVLEASLTQIHNRILRDKPLDLYYYNGCCLPGQRRLYVCTDGNYKVCERIGDSPVIGNVDTGLNEEAVKKYYLNKYEEESIQDCSKCWAVRLCDICYADCYDESGIDIEKKRNICKNLRNRYLSWLVYYHQVLEDYPERIGQISKIEVN